MIKIYFDNKRLILVKGNSLNNPSMGELKSVIETISKENSPKEIKIDCADEQETLILINSFFKPVKAAGGVVMNDNNEILFIFRNGKWDLPKGKIDNGETAEEAAVREVKEECGLENPEIINSLPSTFHTYHEEGQILKETYWYLMKTTEKELHPQTEENITKAEWKIKAEKEEIFANTYGSIKDVIENFWE